MGDVKNVDHKNDQLLYFIKGIFDLNNAELTADEENNNRHFDHKGYSCVTKILRDVKCSGWHVQIVLLVPKNAEFHRDALITDMQHGIPSTWLISDIKKLRLIHAQHFPGDVTFFDYYTDISQE